MSDKHNQSTSVNGAPAHNGRLVLSVLRAITIAALPTWALAAPPAAPDVHALDEVVVSATRVGEQSLQSIAMAISAISAADLDSKGLSGISDFVGMLPSVNMQSLSPGTNDIEMRGLVTSSVSPTNSQERSLVALYLDDSAITQQAFNPDLHVYDLERIEVIRGPQGTLYGAGSMAGTIRLITKKPDPNNFMADADVSVSQTQGGGTNYSVRAVANLPLVENKLGMRVAGYRSDDSGYIDNQELHATKQNDAYSTQGRIALRWHPVDSLILDASATYARLHAAGRNAVYPQLGNYVYSSLTPERFDDYFKLTNITADWDVSFAHLVSSTSYLVRELNEHSSFEAINEALLTPGTRLMADNSNANDIHQFQQELRLVSRPDQRLRWIAGAYFERYSRFYPQYLPVPGFDATFGAEIGFPTFNSQTLYGTPGPDVLFYGTIGITERQFALFGESTYAITPKLDATLGVRYFDFKDDFNLYFTGVAGAIAPGIPVTQNGEQKSSGANPRAVLSYKATGDVMFFLEAARGFRYGGVNEPAPTTFCAAALAAIGLTQSPVAFGPDNLWSYTLGEKGRFDDGRLMFNVDGFYIDWRDVQTIHDIPCGYYFAQNKGRVTSKGVEVETKWRATSALTLGLSGSFTDAAANGPIDNLKAADGDRVPYFPKTILSASGDYRIPVAANKVVLTADYTYRSNAYTQFSPLNAVYREIPGSNSLSASVSYVAPRWSVGLYGTNLTSNHFVSTVAPNNYGPYQPGDQQYWGRPMTIGVHLHVSF
jgi:iron complex outermembrane receptor protein